MKHLFLFAIVMLVWGCAEPPPAQQRWAIQPFGDVPPTDIREAVSAINAKFHTMPVVLPTKELPQKAWYAPRSRYRADVLIKELRETLPDTVHRIVGLTAADISTTKGNIEDWGVLGLGYSPGKSCVVSTFRMQKGSVNKFRYKERLRKVVLHELGHTLGLPHCPNTACLMTDACGSVKTVDAAHEAFCENCKKQIDD